MKRKTVKRAAAAAAALLGIYLVVCCVLVPAVQKKAEGPVAELPAPAPSPERVACIDDNREALIRRLQVIESAREELIFTSYNFQSDESGRDMMAALLHAADRGVRVRVLVDGFCALTSLNSSREFQALAASPNVEVRIYNPISLLKAWRINYRMHDKYIIADDSVYLLGGRNTHNLSLGAYQEKADMDRDVLVYTEAPGPEQSLSQVKAYFERSWALPTTRRCDGSEDPQKQQELRDYYAYMKNGAPEVFRIPDWKSETIPTKGVTLLHNPQQAANKEPVLWRDLVHAMQRGREITIQTPYIVCNRAMYGDLADLTRGGRSVNIITNSVETGANPNGCVDYLNQKSRIRETGSTIYEYAGAHSSHTKTILVDDTTALIGTFNLDMRSAYLDTEMMLVIESEELNAHLRELNGTYMSQSRRIDPDGQETPGATYEVPRMPLLKQALYTVLRVVIWPLRHLL